MRWGDVFGEKLKLFVYLLCLNASRIADGGAITSSLAWDSGVMPIRGDRCDRLLIFFDCRDAII